MKLPHIRASITDLGPLSDRQRDAVISEEKRLLGGTSFLSNITNDIIIGATGLHDSTTMTLSLFSMGTQRTAMHAPARLTTTY